jgi:AAA15 family ATPase/GTPase
MIVYSSTNLKPNDNTGFTPFHFDPKTKDKPGTFNIIFFIDDIKYKYELILDNKMIYSEKLFYSPKGQIVKLFIRKWDNSRSDYTYSWNAQIKKEERIDRNARKNVPLLSSIVQMIEQPELKKVYDWFNNELKDIITPDGNLFRITRDLVETNPEYKKIILSLLSSSDFGNITDLNVEKIKLNESIFSDMSMPEAIRTQYKDDSGDFSIKKVFFIHSFKSGEGVLALEEQSRGTQRFFELAGPLSLLIKNKMTVCIDEFDSSMHPELQENFISKFLKHSHKSQLLITTHNVQLMDSGLFRRDEIWLAEKNMDTGGSDYFSLAEIKGIRKEGSYRKQYLSGKFGGLPNLKN